MSLLEALEEAAFRRYAEASGRAAQLRGYQFDITDTAPDEAREWRGIWIACQRAVVEARNGR